METKQAKLVKDTKKEPLKPIRVTDGDAGVVYELDFSREAVKFAESKGFKIDEVFSFPNTMVPMLWYYAFRKNHRNVPLDKADALRESLGGLDKATLVRLHDLFEQAALHNVVRGDDEEIKNPNLTIEL